MKETLKLRKPLTINGKKVKELTYDFEEIDGNLWDEAAQRSNKSDRNYNIAMYDYIFHKNLFYAAVIAVNPKISWEDLDRITGFDIQSVANTGLFLSQILRRNPTSRPPKKIPRVQQSILHLRPRTPTDDRIGVPKRIPGGS